MVYTYRYGLVITALDLQVVRRTPMKRTPCKWSRNGRIEVLPNIPDQTKGQLT